MHDQPSRRSVHMLDTTPAHHHPGTDPGQDEPGIYEIFLRDVVMPFRISVYPSEHKAPQRVRIDLDLDVRQDRATLTDDIGDVVSYDDIDRKSTRLNSSHANISYAVFCLNKKKDPD